MAAWDYTRALSTFRKEGAGRRAERALVDAFDTNPYVPFYLPGLRKLPRSMPDTTGFGDESEAVEAWLHGPGALEWLLDVLSRDMSSVLSHKLQAFRQE